jgi:hypothetical protein
MITRRTIYTSSLDTLVALLRSLASYEHQYKIPSDVFYRDYLAGKLEDSKDFVEWAGDYRHYIDLKKDLEEKLKVIA